MKPATLLATLVLLAATLTILPGATAELPTPTDIPYCLTPDCGSPAACTERTYTVAADTTNTVTTNADCSIDVETGKGVICVGAWTATSEHDIGPIHWTRHYCSLPGGPLDGISTTSAIGLPAIGLPNPCGPTATCQGPECEEVDVSTTDLLAYLGPHASASVSRDCQATVEERGLHCAIGTAELERTVGPLTVGADVCMPPIDCTCPPMPEFLEVSSMALQPPIQCVMAPCGPQCIVPCVPQVVPSDCELREMTPETVGPLLIPANPRTMVWGSDPSDCTVDIEPAYECVGGWGFDRDVTAAFIQATARVCTGGPFPPAVVQAILDAIQLA